MWITIDAVNFHKKHTIGNADILSGLWLIGNLSFIRESP